MRETSPRRRSEATCFSFIAVAATTVLSACQHGVAGSEPPANGAEVRQRLDGFARGVNLASWFFGVDVDADVGDDYVTPDDVAILRQLGITHVRLPFHLQRVLDESQPDRLSGVEQIERAVERILDGGLNVIVDLHSTDPDHGAQYSARLERETEFLPVFIEFWHSFARALRHTDPNRVLFSPLNEPVFRNHPAVDRGTDAACSVPIGSGSGGHVGGTGSEFRRGQGTHEIRRGALERGNARPNLAEVHAWADRHDVAVMCSEWGVGDLWVMAADRARWLTDVRVALDQHGISWTLWDYDMVFGLVRRGHGRTAVDGSVADALALPRHETLPYYVQPIPEQPVGSCVDGLLDDFEDGDADVAPVGGRAGAFVTYHDDYGSTIEPTVFLPTAGGVNGSGYAAYVHGRTELAGYETHIALKVGLPAYDASRDAGVAFWAKGRGAFSLALNHGQTVPQGGQCQVDDCYGAQAGSMSCSRRRGCPPATPV